MEKDIYLDEDYYLQGTPDVVRHYSRLHEDRENIWIIEKLYYSEALEKYNQFITKVAQFIRSIGYKKPLESSFCLSLMIHLGYLSHDMKFSDLPPNLEKEITCKLGINIVTGDGCCRNYSAIHQDVFGELGLDSELFYCYQGHNTFNRAKRARSNHVINLIQHEGVTYGIDMYNLNNLFHFIDPFLLAEISTTRRSVLRYKPYTELEYGISSIEDVQEKLKRFAEYTQTRPINPFDYEAGLKYEMKRKIREQENLFRDFHEETKVLKKEIKDSIDAVNAELHK